MNQETLPPISDQAFFDKYGAVGERLIDRNIQNIDPHTGKSNLIFQPSLNWPVIPIAGTVDDLGYIGHRFWTMLDIEREVPEEYLTDGSFCGFVWEYVMAETQEVVWRPIFKTLAEAGPGIGVRFNSEYLMAPKDYPEALKRRREKADLPMAVEFHLDVEKVPSWQNVDDFSTDRTCIIDTTGDWAIHSLEVTNTSFLTAKPALMEKILAAIGDKTRMEKLFSMFYSMEDEYEGTSDKNLVFFNRPPFVDLKIRRLRTLNDHLEKHPWLDDIFKDWSPSHLARPGTR